MGVESGEDVFFTKECQVTHRVGITEWGKVYHSATTSVMFNSGRDHLWILKPMGKVC